MIELRQLRYFVRIAELEHFGKAAEELHVVQPALSRQIKQLEGELGVALFERLQRGVRLTAAGKTFLQRVKNVLDELERSVAASRLAAAGKAGSVRIAFSDGATYSGAFASSIRRFRQSHPDVELELLPASSAQQAEMLRQETIDLGFVYWLPKDQSNVAHSRIDRERIVLAVADSNPLARKKAVRLKDIENEPFIWFKRANAPMFFDLIQERCAQAGISMNVVQEAFTESTMLSLVSADIGLTFITEAAHRRKPDNVVLLDVKDLDATINLTAMWRQDDKNPALAEFVKSLAVTR